MTEMANVDYRGYYIKPHKFLPKHLIIVTTGQGGKIPMSFSGMFTSRGLAQSIIDTYLDSKEKGSRNGKASSESGD